MFVNHRQFLPASKFLLGAALLIGGAAAASADSVSFTIHYPGPDNTTYQVTNWTASLDVSKFDPSLGVLQSIDYSLTGRDQGTVKFESLDGAPTTVVTSLGALVTLQRPDTTTLATALPTENNSTPVTAYDNAIDFAGTSGATFTGLQGSNTSAFSNDTAASDLTLFTGASGNPGVISLPVSAVGQSSASGAGNLITQFANAAGADVTVTYNYIAAVPEPGTCALVGAGLCGLLGWRRVNRRKPAGPLLD